MNLRFLVLGALLSSGLGVRADEPTCPISPEEAVEGFVPLYDGMTLAAFEGLNGDTSSYYVQDGVLICKATGKVHIFTEKKVRQLHSATANQDGSRRQ